MNPKQNRSHTNITCNQLRKSQGILLTLLCVDQLSLPLNSTAAHEETIDSKLEHHIAVIDRPGLYLIHSEWIGLDLSSEKDPQHQTTQQHNKTLKHKRTATNSPHNQILQRQNGVSCFHLTHKHTRAHTHNNLKVELSVSYIGRSLILSLALSEEWTSSVLK